MRSRQSATPSRRGEVHGEVPPRASGSGGRGVGREMIVVVVVVVLHNKNPPTPCLWVGREMMMVN